MVKDHADSLNDGRFEGVCLKRRMDRGVWSIKIHSLLMRTDIQAFLAEPRQSERVIFAFGFYFIERS
jgi:hypothetical protein